MPRRAFIVAIAMLVKGGAVIGGASLPSEAEAQETVTLRIAHFLPATSTAHAEFIEPWAQRIEEASDGRIKSQIFPAMQLGGKPPQLFDQVRDGVADVIWTLPGYTPGRFPTIEVFELPFMPKSAVATTQAVQTFYEEHELEEFDDVHPLLFHVHAPGQFHMNDAPIQELEDLEGKKIRAPTRLINDTLGALGATPVGMPVPELPQSLQRGVVDGAVIPWEVVRPLRVHELTDSHTSIEGEEGFYTAVFLFAMNKDTYEGLPDDLKTVIDEHSGMNIAKEVGQTFEAAEAPGRKAAEELGDEFYVIKGQELERWKEASQPVIESWVQSMNDDGKDGEALLEDARSLIEQYSTSE